MNALELRYKLRIGLTGLLNDPSSGFKRTELLGPQSDGTVRMKVHTVGPMGEARIYTVTIKEDGLEPPVRFKPVKADDLFRGVPAAFLLEEEEQ